MNSEKKNDIRFQLRYSNSKLAKLYRRIGNAIINDYVNPVNQKHNDFANLEKQVDE